VFPASARHGLRGCPGWDLTCPDSSAPCLSARIRPCRRLSRSLTAFTWLQARSEQNHIWLQADRRGASRITSLTKHDPLDKTGSSSKCNQQRTAPSISSMGPISQKPWKRDKGHCSPWGKHLLLHSTSALVNLPQPCLVAMLCPRLVLGPGPAQLTTAVRGSGQSIHCLFHLKNKTLIV